jgi:hypothetical protein
MPNFRALTAQFSIFSSMFWLSSTCWLLSFPARCTPPTIGRLAERCPPVDSEPFEERIGLMYGQNAAPFIRKSDY